MVAVQNSGDKDRLSEIQISLLRLFDRGMTEEETLELRRVLMSHFDHELKAELDEVLSRKKYTEEDYHKMLMDDNFGVE